MRATLIAICVLGAGLARAGEPTATEPAPGAVAQALAAADDTARAADAAIGDAALALHEACGRAYLEIAAGSPRLPNVDELLINAARCFARGGSAGAAIALGERLVAEHPQSRLAAATLAQLGALHAALGQYAQAADALGRFTDRYPAEADAPDALWNLIAYRAALGDAAGADRAAALFVRRYAGKRLSAAALVRVDLAQRQAARGEVAAALVTYAGLLKDGRLEPALRAQVLAAQGELAWQRACPRPTIAGLCVRTTPAGLVPVPRRAADATAARASFRAVLHGVDPSDPSVVASVARAQVHLAEEKIEATLALAPMPNLAFGSDHQPTPASLKATLAWLTAWQRSIADADRAITDAVGARHPASAVAVAARAAVFYDQLATTLAAAPTPTAIRGQPAEQAYRDGLAEHAAPLRERGRQAGALCLQQAGELGIVTDDVAVCAALMARVEPRWALAERRSPAAPTTIDTMLAPALPEPPPAP
ncbi:MAG: hypothetical protein IPL61_40090 [Myxococcales bacterium]|nr:hypothetical protein [Myxococcales bacterium]